MPSIMNDELLSPGCTLAEIITHFLSAIWSCVDVKLVTINISQELPAFVLQRAVLLSRSFAY